MKSPTHHRTRRLGLESLERRQLLAGIVTVQVSGGDLIITGDGAGNNIQVTQVGSGQYRVEGRYSAGAATQVRFGNSTAGSQTLSGVTDDFTIEMQGGNDTVGLTYGTQNDLLVPDDLTIRMGNGRDIVTFRNVRTGDDVLVDLGGGNDLFDSLFSIVGTAEGTGDHDLEILGQAGVDDIKLAALNGESIVRGDLKIDAGDTSEKDNVLVSKLEILDDLEVKTFGGDDTVFVGYCDVGDDLTVETGAGRDEVRLRENAVDEIFARLGTGSDDYLGVRGNIARRATFDGGGGANDTLELATDNQFTNQPSISGFE
jgi:delta endotoxin-like protein